MGPDASSVQRAREQLDVVEKSYHLESNQLDFFLKDHINGSLGMIRQCKIYTCICPLSFLSLCFHVALVV